MYRSGIHAQSRDSLLHPPALVSCMPWGSSLPRSTSRMPPLRRCSPHSIRTDRSSPAHRPYRARRPRSADSPWKPPPPLPPPPSSSFTGRRETGPSKSKPWARPPPSDGLDTAAGNSDDRAEREPSRHRQPAQWNSRDYIPLAGATLDDSDGDGIINCLEQAFDTSLSDASSGHEELPVVTSSPGTLTIRYRQLDTPGYITYTVEESTDLGSTHLWTGRRQYARLVTGSERCGTEFVHLRILKALVPLRFSFSKSR